MTDKSPLSARLARAAARFGANLPFASLNTARVAAKTVTPDMLKRILLPTVRETEEEIERRQWQDRGQHLARQEDWDRLSRAIHAADSERVRTEGGESAALLLAYGARGDVVTVVEDALYEGVEPSDEGIAALEAILRQNPDSYACALVVALAHLDIGWAWRMLGQTSPLRGLSDDKQAAHFGRAEDILHRFDGFTLDAPTLAAANCGMLAARPGPRARVADDYEDLIDLDPGCARHMRGLGIALLPANFGTYAALEREADRTARRIADVWGAGGYTWVWADALVADPEAAAYLDPDRFIAGMGDILERMDTQHMVNLFAAFTALHMSDAAPTLPAGGVSPRAAQNRAHLHACLDWLLRDHLHELHPLLWAQAALAPTRQKPLPPRKVLQDKGRDIALTAIAEHYAEEIRDGSTIAFSPAGMYQLSTL